MHTQLVYAQNIVAITSMNPLFTIIKAPANDDHVAFKAGCTSAAVVVVMVLIVIILIKIRSRNQASDEQELNNVE